MTIENFHKILQKSKSECEGHELHLQYLWECNNAKINLCNYRVGFWTHNRTC